MIVFVLGAGRSGTSFYARSLFMMGAYFGKYVKNKSTPINETGLYENQLVDGIRDRLYDILEPRTHFRNSLLNKLYWKYVSHGKDAKYYNYNTFFDDPDWVFPREKSIDDIDPVTKTSMEYLLKDLDGGGVGVIKSPDLLYVYPFWKEMTERIGIKYKIVAVFRNPISVARSRVKMAVRVKLSQMPEDGYIKRWNILNKLLLNYTKEACANGVEVLWNNFDWPIDAMLKRLEENCKRLGLKFDPDKRKDLYDPDLKHHNDNVSDSVKKLGDAEALKVYEELLRMSGSGQ